MSDVQKEAPELSDKNQDVSQLAARARVPQHVVYRVFVKETVILNLETGKYHGLNPTAGRMLEAVEGAASLREAAAKVADEYGQPIEQIEHDLLELCGSLAERGLIQMTFDDDGS